MGGDLVPKCSPDGFYAPVQHRPQNYSQLFCADRNGDPIDDYAADLDSRAGQEMDCECAQAKLYLATGVTKPSCCSNGNYRKYQCQGGLCFCVDRFGVQYGKEEDYLNIGQLECATEEACM